MDIPDSLARQAAALTAQVSAAATRPSIAERAQRGDWQKVDEILTRRRVTIPSSPQPQTLRIDLLGEVECEAQAKGGGLFGFITASSAATASFPNSIEVGLPTAVGGGPLPRDIRIYDAEDGSVYTDTTASPVTIVPVPPRTNNAPFAITNHFLDTNGLLHLIYPASTNDYYLAYWGQTVTTITNPFALAPGVIGAGEFLLRSGELAFAANNSTGTHQSAATSFFRLR